jgi:hypothetical protein
LRQLGLGLTEFAGDHKDKYPPAGYQCNSGTITWDTWIYNYLGGGNNVPQNTLIQVFLFRTRKTPPPRVCLRPSKLLFAPLTGLQK